MQRDERRRQAPDLGMLAGRLLLSVQEELFETLAEQGHPHVRPRHGGVLAYLDAEGTRATELPRRSGQRKQIVGTIIDELVDLGYVRREPDPPGPAGQAHRPHRARDRRDHQGPRHPGRHRATPPAGTGRASLRRLQERPRTGHPAPARLAPGPPARAARRLSMTLSSCGGQGGRELVGASVTQQGHRPAARPGWHRRRSPRLQAVTALMEWCCPAPARCRTPADLTARSP